MNLTTTTARSLALKFAVVFIGSLILTASAKISVPFYPVPLTLQILALLLIAFLLPPVLALSTVSLYIFQGAIGLPVFAGGGGLLYMTGPTGGYILGFFLMVALISFLSQKFPKNILTLPLFGTLGVLALYIPGILWLGTVIGWDKPILELGAFPFLLGDALKIVLASLIALASQKLLKV